MFKGTPLRQSKADLSRTKDAFERIHEIVVLYSSPFLIDMSFANLVWKHLHSSAMPPVVVKIKGVKVPALLNFQNPVHVQSFLLIFMFAINLLNGEIFVTLCVWVTNPHVEKGRALPIPKATSMNIQSGIWCLICTPRQHFSRYLLENGFHLYIVANNV